MARNHANSGRVYRAVITTTYDNGQGFTETFGPYDTAAPAKGLITRALSDAERSRGEYRHPSGRHDAVGHIETAEVKWERA